MALEQLRQTLLYNDILDVWIALCEEKRWDWYNLKRYQQFLEFLSNEGVHVKELAVCAQEKGKKAALVRALSRLQGTPLRTQVVKLDTQALGTIRSFSLR